MTLAATSILHAVAKSNHLSTSPFRRLALNMPDNAEHHAYSALPFHALPVAIRALAPRIAAQAPGYIAVNRDIIAAFRRLCGTAWDVDQVPGTHPGIHIPGPWGI